MPTTLTLQEGRYSIEQELPSRAGGLVYHAYDVTGEAQVTLVEVKAPLPKLASAAQRDAAAVSFLEQAQTLATFRHRSFLPVTGFFTEAGRNFIVTDGSAGTDLASLISDASGSVTIADACAWADSILDALHGLHTFRPPTNYPELRPWNVMIGAEGEVRLLASGAFRFDSIDNSSGAAAETENPIAYSPLEQIWSGLDAASQKVIINSYDEGSERVLKQPLDARSDIFSVGALMYQLLAGRLPVDALERSIEVIDGNTDPLPSPHSVNPSVPVEVSDVVMKSMELKREYRFDSAAIMRQVLKTALLRARERDANIGTASVTVPSPASAVKPVSGGDSANSAGDHKSAASSPAVGRAVAEKKEAAGLLADAEDDLLGLLSNLEDTKAPVRESVSAVSVVRVEEQFDSSSEIREPGIADEFNTEPKELSTETLPEARPSVAYTVEKAADDADMPMFGHDNPSKGLGLPAAAAAAAVLIAALIGGWFYLNSGSASAGSAGPEAPSSSQIESSANSAVPAAEPVRSEAQPTSFETPLSGAEPPASEPAPDVRPELQQRPQSVTASQKNKKTPAATVKAPAQKKAVTVDDLINDN